MAGVRKIFSVDDLSDGDVSRIFFAAKRIKDGIRAMPHAQRPQQIVLAFFEPSTRTKLSFEMAGNKVGARTLTFDCASSSQNKGESKMDTLKTLAALGPDLLVIRQQEPLDPSAFASFDTHMINAGDGTNEHPTQALLDCFTLLQKFESANLEGKKILICGDVARSRVFHSNVKLMKRLGASLFVMAPSLFSGDVGLGIDGRYARFDQVKDKFDVVMILRVQEERMEHHIFDRKHYFQEHGLNLERFLDLGPDCLLMHPGPMNDGVEIDARLADHERSLVLQQVQMGVVMRTAMLSTLFSLGESYA